MTRTPTPFSIVFFFFYTPYAVLPFHWLQDAQHLSPLWLLLWIPPIRSINDWRCKCEAIFHFIQTVKKRQGGNICCSTGTGGWLVSAICHYLLIVSSLLISLMCIHSLSLSDALTHRVKNATSMSKTETRIAPANRIWNYVRHKKKNKTK